MKTKVVCENPRHGELCFYIVENGNKYFLFRQDYRRSVAAYFRNGVLLKDALNYAKARGNTALKKTLSKIPLYIRNTERINQVEILEKTKIRSNKNYRVREYECA